MHRLSFPPTRQGTLLQGGCPGRWAVLSPRTEDLTKGPWTPGGQRQRPPDLLPDGEDACSRSPSTARCLPVPRSLRAPRGRGWRWSRVRGLSPVQAPAQQWARCWRFQSSALPREAHRGLTPSARGWGLGGQAAALRPHRHLSWGCWGRQLLADSETSP